MLITILKKLITFKTVSRDHAENLRAIRWIKESLKTLPLYIRLFTIDSFPSLMITTQKTKRPRLLLAAHLDVVDGSEKMFEPRMQGERLYGRGAFDMKFALACYLQLCHELGTSVKKYDFGIMITTDEEVGGASGMKALLEKGFRSDICLLPDGGKDWIFEEGAKGAMHGIVRSIGVAAHGSRPWLGKNAIEHLAVFLSELRTGFPAEPCPDAQHRHPTMNVGVIQGGNAINSIADEACAKIDFRFASPVQERYIRRHVKTVLRKHRDIHVAWNKIGDAFRLPVKDPYFKMFARLVQEYAGKPTQYLFSHGSSDVRYLVKYGIPAIVVRPQGDGHHSEYEWIDTESLKIFYRVVREFVIKTAKKG